MIAFARPQSARNANAQDAFVAMLPQIKQQAAIAFRSRRPEEREELTQEVIANAYVAFARLVQLGREEIAYATPLAMYAVRQVLSGRRVGTKLNRRDVMSPANRRVTVEPLQHFDRHGEVWKEGLVEDRHAGPAETAVARIDIAKWFRKLPATKRRVPNRGARYLLADGVGLGKTIQLGGLAKLIGTLDSEGSCRITATLSDFACLATQSFWRC